METMPASTFSELGNMSNSYHSFIQQLFNSHNPRWMGWTLHGTSTDTIADSSSQLIKATRNTHTTIRGSFQVLRTAQPGHSSVQRLCPSQTP